MKHTQMIRTFITEAGHGDNCALQGLIDYLVYEKHIPFERILEIAERHFGIRRDVLLFTLVTVH